MNRRDFLTIPAQGVSAAVISALGASLIEAQDKSAQERYLKVPLRFFSAKQAAIINRQIVN